MKLNQTKLFQRFLILFAILLVSCNEVEKKNQSTLAGKVYLSSDGMDSTCNALPLETDFFQRLLFLNDSTFINIIYNCCGGDTIDFAYEYYYTGKYLLSDTSLELSYNSQCAVNYVKEDPSTFESDSSKSISHIEVEKGDITKLKLKRLSCKDIVYFEQKNDNYVEYLTPVNDTLTKLRKELEESGVWNKMFNKVK